MIELSEITLVGCGTLGASLAYKLCLMSLDSACPLGTLNLIDNDYLEEKNFPYLSQGYDSELLGTRKAFALKDILRQINRGLEINPHYLTYPSIPVGMTSAFIIDCRDTRESVDLTNLKLNFDGNYGSMSFYPGVQAGAQDARYRFGNSRFYADIFASLVARQLLKTEYKYKKGQYVIDLKHNLEEMYEVFTDSIGPSREDHELQRHRTKSPTVRRV